MKVLLWEKYNSIAKKLPILFLANQKKKKKKKKKKWKNCFFNVTGDFQKED